MEGKENLQGETISCAYCRGKGRERGSSMMCIVCKGRGANATSGPYESCVSCNGKGRKNSVTALYCLNCKGRGVISQNNVTQVRHKTNSKNFSFREKEGGTKTETSWIKKFFKNLTVQES